MVVLSEHSAILRARNLLNRAALGFGLALPLVWGIGAAQAHTASQIAPPSFSPAWQRPGGGLFVPESAGPELPLPFALPSLPAQLGVGLPRDEETPFAVMVGPYGFGAFGLTRQRRPTALERPIERSVAYGGGVRLAAAPGARFTNAAATLEEGRADRSGRLPSDNRFTASVSLSF